MPQDGMTLDEIGAQVDAANATKPKLGEIKLEGDDVPETFKGKSVADVVAQHDALQKALKISEEARQTAVAVATSLSSRAPAASAAPTAPAAPEEKELTAEDLKKIHEEDPLRAMMLTIEQNNKKLLRAFESRVAPLVSGTAANGETAARTKYPTEFQVLGKEIQEFVGTLNDQQRAALAQPGAWDQLVKYVRGENLDKMIAHHVSAQNKTTLDTARQKQDEDAALPIGVSGGGNRQPQINPKVQWDSTMDEIIKQLGISKEDYLKFYVEG